MTTPPQLPQPQQHAVRLVSGEPLNVMTAGEATWFVETKDAYLRQTRFTDVTDLRDVDRVLVLELMIFRWTNWLASGIDYFGDEIENTKTLIGDIAKYSSELTRTKQAMGLAKSVRDAAANSGDFSTWFDDVKARAKLFKIHRQEQLGMTLALFEELSGIIGSFDRSDEEERGKLGFRTEHDILEWVRNTALPKYRELDQFFQENSQSLWIRQQ